MALLLRWLILAGSILLAAYVIPGIDVKGFWSAFVAAAILGLLNAIFRPILVLLTLPINVLTFGLFTFIINAFILMMVSGVISGLQIQGFWSGVLGALVISGVNWLVSTLFRRRDDGDYRSHIDLQHKGNGRWQ